MSIVDKIGEMMHKQSVSRRYKRFYSQWQSLPPDERRKTAERIWSGIYEEISMEDAKAFSDDVIACSLAEFSCPYPAHVTAHVEQALSKRTKDESDPTLSYAVKHLDGDSYRVSVLAKALVEGEQEPSPIAAQASLMSALTRLPECPDASIKGRSWCMAGSEMDEMVQARREDETNKAIGDAVSSPIAG